MLGGLQFCVPIYTRISIFFTLRQYLYDIETVHARKLVALALSGFAIVSYEYIVRRVKKSCGEQCTHIISTTPACLLQLFDDLARAGEFHFFRQSTILRVIDSLFGERLASRFARLFVLTLSYALPFRFLAAPCCRPVPARWI